MIRLNFVFFILPYLLLFSCGEQIKTDTQNNSISIIQKDSLAKVLEQQQKDQDSLLKYTTSAIHETSLILAGLNVDSTSSKHIFTQHESWTSYSEKLNKKWDKMKSNRFMAISKWRATDLDSS